MTGPRPLLLEAKGLAVGYGNVPVVADLTLTLAAGELLALVGTNGSGKSTLLRTIVGLLPPVAGELQIVGQSAREARLHTAYVAQFHRGGFVLPLCARDVVRMGRYADRGLLGRFTATDDALVDEAMARMGITELANRPIAELSGGQHQRTHLAQALARRADVLVLDEPSAGLDAAAREIYERAVAEERDRGAGVIVATHDIGEAERATEVLLLAGRVVARGRPGEVLTAEHLLDAFGMGLRRVGDALLAGEEPHAHGEDAEPSGAAYPRGYRGRR